MNEPDDNSTQFDGQTLEHDNAPNTFTDDEASDEQLVARTVAGDETTFEQLFNRHQRRVALVASRFFRRREQIEEIVQESFTKAYFALPDFSDKSEGASFAAWLARIAFNVCYDELRRQKRRPDSQTGEVTFEEAKHLSESLRSHSAENNIEAATVARDLAGKLLAKLTPEDRLILVMLDAEGMSVKEIAELNGWTASKVKVRAHRARASLRGVLKKFL